MPNIRSLILGPGAIGALVCAQMQQLGPVYVHPHRDGLSLASSLLMPDTKTELNWQLLGSKENENFDIVWVCCKAHQATEVVKVLHTSHPSAAFVLLHNGMGPQQTLIEHFGDSIIPGSTTCGALKLNDSTFTQSSFGETLLGINANHLARFPFLADVLKDQKALGAPLNLKREQEIWPILWRKLLINACINPLTAYEQIQNGVLLEPKYEDEWKALVSEIESIMRANGITPPENSLGLLQNIAKNSAENWSSMAMDVKHNRTTEIDSINGFLIQSASQHNLETPHLKLWYKRIAFTEKS